MYAAVGRRAARGQEIRGAAAELRGFAVRRQGLGGRGQMRVGGRSGHFVGVVGQSKWNQRAVLGGGRPLGGSWGTSQSGSKVGFGSPLTPISDGFGKKGHSWKKSG